MKLLSDIIPNHKHKIISEVTTLHIINTDTKMKKKLIKLMPKALSDDLTIAEVKLLDVAEREKALSYDYRIGDDEIDSLLNADSWDANRIIRAEFLNWVLISEEVSVVLKPRWFEIIGVKITGNIDLSFAHLPFPISLKQCWIVEKMSLKAATLEALSLRGSRTNSILADGITVNKGLQLSNGFHAEGTVRLAFATIYNELTCRNGTFESRDNIAIIADGIKVHGGVFFDIGFEAFGKVSLIGANIDGNIVFDDANINNSNGIALSADGLRTSGEVTLRRLKAFGEIRFAGATIGGNLSFIGASIENKNGIALSAGSLSLKGSLLLRESFIAKGDVDLARANIQGDLNCIKGSIESKTGLALSADGSTIKSAIFLKNFKAKGEVSFNHVEIGGVLDCSSSIFHNPKGRAICAEGLKIEGGVFFNDGFESYGEVRFTGAKIGMGFDCDGAIMVNEKGNSLYAYAITIANSMSMSNGFHSKGEVNLSSANINSDLHCIHATFNNAEGNSFQAERLKVHGVFMWLSNSTGVIDLFNACVGQLFDAEDFWPKKNNLLIDGFEYQSFTGDKTPKSAEKRLKWLRLQPDKPFKPQPYEQLARFLRGLGHEEDAKIVLIAKQNDLRKHGELSVIAKAFYAILNITVGYGLHPMRAISIGLCFILLGAGIFEYGNKIKVIQPSKERIYMDTIYKHTRQAPTTYPKFNSLFYSLDTFVPFVDLHQESYWLPDSSRLNGNWFRYYLWIHIISGWFFSTLAALAFTGLVKKE